MRRAGRAGLLAGALLAGCAALPSLDDVVPPPVADPAAEAAEAQAMAAALAGAAGVCLDAPAANRTLTEHVAAAGDPRALGIRPAPVPLTGWVVRSGRANLYEGEGGCRIEPTAPPPQGTTTALLLALAARAEAAGATPGEPSALPGGLVARRWTADGTVLLTLGTEGTDGAPVILIVPSGR